MIRSGEQSTGIEVGIVGESRRPRQLNKGSEKGIYLTLFHSSSIRLGSQGAELLFVGK